MSADASARLFRPSAIVPRIPELEGRSATCTLASGALPAGMTLNTDCTITGTPTQAGSFPMVVRASVEGLSGLFERPASVLVSGPSLTYIMPSAIAAGSGVDLPTLNNFWSAGPADFVTYSVQGALPPGLAVDARTGRIHGTATTLGSYEFTLSVRTENAGRVFTQVQALSNRMEVRPARVFYNASQAWVGLPFTTSPVLPDGTANFRYAVSGLPKGLSMDPQTGVVSGIARAPQPFPSTVPRQFSRRVTVNVTITLNGLTFVDPLDVSL